ncbi:hypothetical protein PRZ48_001650 [Zasmidium cellare]|uniref:Major facilitator superfamily (MFS) profile domain-containing protein n=1 Tax=Zasmidium cellare TaxID=395010 RepID=A0ABR0F3P8_ZASCE|nr:hypothetical protein PRZ48_001650 [Zasmidium cellare]
MDEVHQVNGPRRRFVESDEESNFETDSIVDAPWRAHIFENNDQRLIDNPLANVHHIEREIRSFVKDHGFQQQESLFVKAGQILRDPEAWRAVPNLTDEEKEALEKENSKGFWKQPKELRVTIITLCIAAVVQGWNQTASNGANLNWPSQLGLTKVDGCDPTGTDAWIFAIVNAMPFFSASLVGCWISDPLNEYFFGRRPAICFSGILILAAMIGSACSQTWRQLLACRALLGIGMGCKASVVPVFAAEVSPAHIRGSLTMNWQLMDAFGIFLGFTANLIVSGVGPTAWRWQTASSVFPCISLLSLIYVCSDSPRFLLKRGPRRYKDAYTTLLSLRGQPILAAKELLYVHYQMEVEKRYISGTKRDADIVREEQTVDEVKGNTTSTRTLRSRFGPTHSINYFQKFGQLFTNKRIRRATVAAVVVMVSQQLCGVNVLALYSSNIFCESGEHLNGDLADPNYLEPLFLSWGIGLTNFLFAFPAYWLIDKRGRRWLLLVALPFMALSMLAAALSYQIPGNSPAHSPVIGLFTYIFMVFYSFSMGPVPFTMSAEVFPLENRVVGMSFAVFANMLGLGLLTLFTPIITVKLSHGGLLGIFAGLNLVAFVLIFFFVRETSGATLGRTAGSMTFMSLEELNYVFGVSTKAHALYQTKTVLPWMWKFYVRRDKSSDRPEQLYTWANARKAQKQEGVEPREE